MGKWNLQLQDLLGTAFEISFYVAEGKGALLLGNEIISQSDQLGQQKLLSIPAGVLHEKSFLFATYTDTAEPVSLNEKRTYLDAVTPKTAFFKALFSSHRQVPYLLSSKSFGSKKREKKKDGKVARRFEMKSYGYFHLFIDDMVEIYRPGITLNPVLRRSLQAARDRCHTCQSTWAHLQSKKDHSPALRPLQ